MDLHELYLNSTLPIVTEHSSAIMRYFQDLAASAQPFGLVTISVNVNNKSKNKTHGYQIPHPSPKKFAKLLKHQFKVQHSVKLQTVSITKQTVVLKLRWD